MNPKIYQTLEFEKIQQQLAKETRTEIGKIQALNLKPSTQAVEIEQQLQSVDDVKHLFELDKRMPVSQLANVKPFLKRLDIGADLNGKELAAVGRVLRASGEVSTFFSKLKEAQVELNQLYTIADEFIDLRDLMRKMQNAIADDGSVYDNASATLHGLRQGIKREEAGIRVKLDQIIRSNKASYLSEAIITIRNNRFVIPVKQEYRNAFGGVVHDQSSSGQTLYIEPQTVLDANNHLRSLQVQEDDEIRRIFQELSAELAPYTSEIAENNQRLGDLDLIQAKFFYAREIGANRPVLAKASERIDLKEARHPLLDRKTVVANDIHFSDAYNMIVITGPNTGGKTITLKTVGLLQLMAQAGLYITAKVDSRVEIFNEIFADIGDEQSIEQSLSTFSGHMTNIIRIVEATDDQSLVLIDELGSGTDPQEGAAIAIAVLNRLAFLNARVMATTHYPELKTYAYEHPGAINASMEFNEITLEPTYQLLIGVPGRSNAFDISQRLGLPIEMVDEARSYIQEDSQNLNEMLLDLEAQRHEYEDLSADAAKDLADAENLLNDLKRAQARLEADKEIYMNRARKEANRLVEETKVKADAILAEIREWQLNHPTVGNIKEHEMIDRQSALSNLTQEEAQLKKNKVLQKAKKNKERKKAFEPGDEVNVLTYGQRGTLVEKRDKDWVVQMGMLKMEVAEKDLSLVDEKPKKEKNHRAGIKASKAKSVNTSLDLRGERYEEAMIRLSNFIDSALLAGHGQVTIIHGHGTGVLREGVQKALKKHPRVESFTFAPYNMGGNGATIAKFKG
ncbi:endonuclease MutS2 [Aerococcaceae bacterium 50-4]